MHDHQQGHSVLGDCVVIRFSCHFEAKREILILIIRSLACTNNIDHVDGRAKRVK